MRFAVESWAPEYGTSVEADLDETNQSVDLGVEAAVEEWAPLAPPADVTVPGRLLFVDGVRRVDARLWIDHAGSVRPALCATIAAGVVCVERSTAVLADARVVRGVFAHGVALEPIDTSCGTYLPSPVAGSTPEALVIALQDRMTNLEIEVTREADGDDLVLVDGPLRSRSHVRGAVGYIKTLHTSYLPSPTDAVIGRLGAGERTPLFRIEGPFPRLSWYTRLPGVKAHALSGVVRCEIGGDVDVADAIVLAHRVTALLPRFASRPHKDTRAPQNLYPIAGLERALRRRLGDPALLERALRVAARRAAAPA